MTCRITRSCKTWSAPATRTERSPAALAAQHQGDGAGEVVFVQRHAVHIGAVDKDVLLLQPAHRFNMTADIVERMFRHLVSVAHRIVRRTLHVDVVIGTADRRANQFDSILFQQFDELNGFLQIGVHVHAGTVAAECVGIASAVPFHRMADSVLAFDEREDIEQTHPGGEIESGHMCLKSFRDFPEEAGAVFKGATVFARAVVGGQELMTEIAVSVFDVNKIEACFLSDFRGFDEVLHDLADLFIRDDILWPVVKFFVEKRMGICRFRFENIGLVRMRIASGMGQLEPDAEIIVATEFFPVNPVHLRTDVFQRFFCMIRNEKLLRIASAGMHNGTRFRSVKKFCSAFGKTEPAALGEFAGRAVIHAVPAFHGKDRPAVADGASLVFYRLGQCGRTIGFDFRREPDGEILAFDILVEGLNGFEFHDFPVRWHIVYLLLLQKLFHFHLQ